MFIYGCIIFLIFTVIATKRLGIKGPFSKGIATAAAISILAAISLGQNYTQSLIPEANDGMGISNHLAYWIIGEDGWSKELFRASFEQSLYITLLLIIAYPIVLIAETKWNRKSA